MKTQVTLEQVVFFAVAKSVRNEQNYRLRQAEIVEELSKENEGWELSEKEKRTSLYIHVSDYSVYSNAYALANAMDYKLSRKRFWAVFYKLQEMGMVKIHKGNSKRATMLGLGHKGVQYVQSIKAKREAV